MSSADAYHIVKEHQYGEDSYRVNGANAKQMLITAMKQLWEQNANIYIARIEEVE